MHNPAAQGKRILAVDDEDFLPFGGVAPGGSGASRGQNYKFTGKIRTTFSGEPGGASWLIRSPVHLAESPHFCGLPERHLCHREQGKNQRTRRFFRATPHYSALI